MKNKKIILALIITVLILTVLVGCAGKQFTVTFDSKGGSVPDSIKTTKAQLMDLPTSEKEGYAFGGWYMDEEFTKPFTKNSLVNEDITHDITVYAKWLKKFIIEFDTVGGSAVESISVVEGVYSLPRNPTKNGFVFEGWYTDSEYNTAFNEQTTILENTKVYARWLLDEELTVKYYDYEDNVISTQSVRPLDSVTVPDLADTDKYSFIRWSTDLGRVTENCNIRPIFTIKSYKLYVYNGTQEVLSLTLPYGTVIDLYKPSLEKKNQILKDYLVDENGRQYDFLHTVEKDIKLYLQYEPKDITVTYVLSGGINSSENPNTINAGSKLTLKNPTRDNHTFIGWYIPYYSNGSISERKISGGSFVNDITVYAKWDDGKSYAYYLDGTECINAEYLAIGESLTLAPVEKDFYTFNGWYYNGNSIVSAEMEKTCFIDATWTPKSLAINYNVPDGADYKPSVNPSTFKITENIKLFSATYEDGYEFMGWYLDSKFTKQISVLNESTITVDGTIELYARFEPKEYEITYNISGNIVDSQRVKYNQAIELLDNVSRNGYELDGWYTNADCTEKFTKSVMGNENITIYAKWKIVDYTVTLMDNTKVLGEKKYNIESGLTLESASKEGYTFDGWYKDQNYTQKIDQIESGNAGNITLYAKFNPNKYTVSYYKGDVELDSFEYLFNTIIPQYPNTYISGYTFKGWYLDENFEQPLTEETMPAYDIKLYGKWEIAE